MNRPQILYPACTLSAKRVGSQFLFFTLRPYHSGGQNKPMTRSFLAPAKFMFLLRATCLDGRALPPIECASLDEVQSKAAALAELGYLAPRVRITRRAPGA